MKEAEVKIDKIFFENQHIKSLSNYDICKIFFAGCIYNVSTNITIGKSILENKNIELRDLLSLMHFDFKSLPFKQEYTILYTISLHVYTTCPFIA